MMSNQTFNKYSFYLEKDAAIGSVLKSVGKKTVTPIGEWLPSLMSEKTRKAYSEALEYGKQHYKSVPKKEWPKLSLAKATTLASKLAPVEALLAAIPLIPTPLVLTVTRGIPELLKRTKAVEKAKKFLKKGEFMEKDALLGLKGLAASNILSKGLLGVGAGGLAAGAAGGYVTGKKKGKAETLENVSEAVNEIANDAFMQGVEYALSGQAGPEKQSFYAEFARQGLVDELEKLGAFNIGAVLPKLKEIGGTALSGVKGVAGRLREQAGEGIKETKLLSSFIKSKSFRQSLKREQPQLYNKLKNKALVVAAGAMIGVPAGLGIRRVLKSVLKPASIKALGLAAKGTIGGVPGAYAKSFKALAKTMKHPSKKGLRRSALALGTLGGALGAGGAGYALS